MFSAASGSQVAADFTRLGGRNRIQTAVEATRFWLAPPPHVVTTPAFEDQALMLKAVKCAVFYDAPLLFISKNQKQQSLVTATIERLQAGRRIQGFSLFMAKQEQAWECDANHDQPTLNNRIGSLLLPGFRTHRKLAPVVIFAASKATNDSPDVAVGLALAAHLAKERANQEMKDREVSLVVIPRYLEAAPGLENELRNQHELVKSGLVLGQTGILSEDTRALLREILASPDRRGFFGALQSNLGQLQTLFAALLALLGLQAASRAITHARAEYPLARGRTPDDDRGRRSADSSSTTLSPRPVIRSMPKEGNREEGRRMKQRLRKPPPLRLLLGSIGLAVIAYGCVIAWRSHASAVVLVVGAVLFILAFVGDRDAIVFAWDDRAVRIQRKRAERQQDAARDLPQQVMNKLLEQKVAQDEIAIGAVTIRSEKLSWFVVLELTKPLPPPTHAIGCRVDGPDGKYFAIPDIEPGPATRWLTYRTRFTQDFQYDKEPSPGEYYVWWFEFGDYLEPATPIAFDTFQWG